MNAERLHFSFYEHGRSLVVALSGPVDAALARGLRQELSSLAGQGRPLVLDLLRVTSLSEDAVPVLLALASDLEGGGGDLAVLCAQPELLELLAPWRHLFGIHPSLASVVATGFREKGIRWSRRTGFRIAAPLAAFLAVLLTGWMATLMVLVVWQFRELEAGRARLERLVGENAEAARDIAVLEARLKPLASLGLLEMPRVRSRTLKPVPKPAPVETAPPAPTDLSAPEPRVPRTF